MTSTESRTVNYSCILRFTKADDEWRRFETLPFDLYTLTAVVPPHLIDESPTHGVLQVVDETAVRVEMSDEQPQ